MKAGGARITARSSSRKRLALVGATVTLALGAFLASSGIAVAGSTTPNVPSSESAASDQYDTEPIVTTAKPPTAPSEVTREAEESQPVASVEEQPAASSEVSGATGESQPAPSGGTLPFTGFGLATTAIIGSALLGLGIFVRRRKPRDE